MESVALAAGMAVVLVAALVVVPVAAQMEAGESAGAWVARLAMGLEAVWMEEWAVVVHLEMAVRTEVAAVAEATLAARKAVVVPTDWVAHAAQEAQAAMEGLVVPLAATAVMRVADYLDMRRCTDLCTKCRSSHSASARMYLALSLESRMPESLQYSNHSSCPHDKRSTCAAHNSTRGSGRLECLYTVEQSVA